MELAHTHMARWEQELLHLALETTDNDTMQHNSTVGEQGYALAERVTRENSKSFYLASGLLPGAKRRAVRVLYAFCRITDDLVDKVSCNGVNPNAPAQRLAEWRARALTPHPMRHSPKWDLSCGMRDPATPPADDVILNAWYGVRAHYRIPSTYVRQLVDGIGSDLTHVRYETFDELAKYCYGVASTVGLMAMHIIGYEDRAAIPYAVKLGVALQLTNILRDIGEDFRWGRVYLPQEDLARFGYTEDDLARATIDQRFTALIDFEIARAKKLYAEAWDGIKMLSPDGRLAIAASADLYRGILDKIVENRYDVFHRRAHLGAAEKLARIPELWWNVRTMK